MAAPTPIIKVIPPRPSNAARMEDFLRMAGRRMEGPLGEMPAQIKNAPGIDPNFGFFSKIVTHISEIGRLMNGDAPHFFSEGDKLALKKLWSLFETMEDGGKRIGMGALRKECKPLKVPEAVMGKIKKFISRGGRDTIQFVEAGPFAGSRATGLLHPDGRLSAILIHTMSMQQDASGQPVEVPNKAILIILPD
ncbi:MAG: hypothetical protein PHQ80_01525 [Candidatus ainarchaeum sp.]|nr:hypothetical protein [Candidatus ainarchaeum sp.]MDD5096847.1 hypothetical protein [Candidatus ainarchaeum sp.]